MNSTDGLVVVGSGPAGISAALAYRATGGEGPVTVFGADVDPPYERPPLSKEFLRGELHGPLVLLHKAGDYRDQEIDVRLDEAVLELDVAAHQVVTSAGATGYDTCVLATGAEPLRPPIPGGDGPRIHTLRSAREAVGLERASGAAGRAVVVGSGFIGCEAASSLARRGLRVTLIGREALPLQVRLGEWAAACIAEWLTSDGVELIPQRTVQSFTDDGDAVVVRTDAGATFRADLVLLATGVAPRIGLAESAGLTCERGRIRVDSGLRTSAPDVWAAGDVALAMNVRRGQAVEVEHWGDALAMGEIAGANAAGRSAQWDSVPGFWSTIGDHTLKYAAWGDGFDEVRVDHEGMGFAVWYGRAGRTVGVLTQDRDHDYDHGQGLVAVGAPLPG